MRQAVADLDRIEAWVGVSGFVNAVPGFIQTSAVLNAFSEVHFDVLGDQGWLTRPYRGRSRRSPA